MKRILILTLAILLAAPNASAVTENECIYGLGLSSQVAAELCGAVDVDGHFVPSSNSAYDLGTAALSFEDLFVEKILADNDSTSALDADVTTVTTATPLLGVSGTSGTQSHLGLVQNIASAQGAVMDVMKTRAAAGSTNANTIISSGDDAFRLRWWGSSGTAFEQMGEIVLESGGTPGASADQPGRARVLLSPDGSATPVEIFDLSVTSAIELFARADAQRLFSLDGSSDTALTFTFGDAGTTATQGLTISASTADADDDSTLTLAGGGASGGTRGSWITLPGEEVAGGSDVEISAGAGDEVQLSVADTAEVTVRDDVLAFSGAAAKILPGATSLTFRNNADSAENLGIADSGNLTIRGTLINSNTAHIGWTVVDGTDNTDCSSQCTSAAVFGFNLAAGATAPVLVGPGDTTADICLCAGGS